MGNIDEEIEALEEELDSEVEKQMGLQTLLEVLH